MNKKKHYNRGFEIYLRKYRRKLNKIYRRYSFYDINFILDMVELYLRAMYDFYSGKFNTVILEPNSQVTRKESIQKAISLLDAVTHHGMTAPDKTRLKAFFDYVLDHYKSWSD